MEEILKVCSVIPPRPSHLRRVLIGRFTCCLQNSPTYDELNASASGYYLDYLEEGRRIFAARSSTDDFVRVCSSTSFYKKQIAWSIMTVSRYWHFILINRKCRFPDSVPATVRFCLSWIIGHDCTDPKAWPTDKFHAWLYEKLGRFHHSDSDILRNAVVCSLRRVSEDRLSAFSSLYKLTNARLPVDGVNLPFTHKEVDVVRKLAMLRFASASRPYASPLELYPIMW